MKFAEKTDLALNILYIIMCVIVVVIAAICFRCGVMSIGGAGDAVRERFSEERIGWISGIFFISMGIGSVIIGLILLDTIVNAFSRRKKYKLTGQSDFIKKNLLAKIKLNTICLIFVVIELFSELDVLLCIVALVLAALEVLIIMAYRKLRFI